MSPTVRAIVQARMSSARFPGKVLAPFQGRPILAHVLEKLALKLAEATVIATSTDVSDDPVEAYGRSLGVPVFRGPLDNIVARFQLCVERYPCEWFFRVCADSPLLDSSLVPRLLEQAGPEVDLVTNTYPRTFAKGLSLELVRASTFAGLDAGGLSIEQREHITKVYYDNPGRFRIVNVFAEVPADPDASLAIDTIQDLFALEQTARVPLR